MNTSAKRSPDLTPLSPQQELIDREQKPTGRWVNDPRFPGGNLRRWVSTSSTDNMEQEVQERKHMKTLSPSTYYPSTMPLSTEGLIFAGIEARQASSLSEPHIPITKTISKAESPLMETIPASDAGVEGKTPAAGESLTTYETVDLEDDESDWESIHTPSSCGSDRAPDSDLFEPFELIDYATERMTEEEDAILGYGISDSTDNLIAKINNTTSDTYFTDASPQETESRLQPKFENYITADDWHFAAAWTEYFDRSEVSLENWQRLLRDLGVKGDLSSITLCKKVTCKSSLLSWTTSDPSLCSRPSIPSGSTSHSSSKPSASPRMSSSIRARGRWLPR